MADSTEHRRAATLIDARRPGDALAILASLLASDPDDGHALRLLAIAKYKLGDHSEGLIAAQRAAALLPDDAWVWRIVAEGARGAGRPRKAQSSAQRAVALAPEHWQSHMQLAVADIAAEDITARTDASAAEAARLAPLEAEPRFVIGLVAYAREDWAAAERAYQQALSLDPLHTRAQTNLGLVRLRQRKPGLAAAGFVDVLALDPGAVHARRHLFAATRAVLRTTFFLLTLATVLNFVLTVVAQSSAPASESAQVAFVIRVLIIAAAGAAMIAQLVRFRLQSGARFAKTARAVLAFDKPLLVRLASAALAYAALVVGCFLPAAWTTGLDFFAEFVIIANMVVNVDYRAWR